MSHSDTATRRSFLGSLLAAASGALVMASTLLEAGKAAAQTAPKYGIAVKYGVPAPPEGDKKGKKGKKKKVRRPAPKYGPKVTPKYGVDL